MLWLHFLSIYFISYKPFPEEDLKSETEMDLYLLKTQPLFKNEHYFMMQVALGGV